MIEDFSFSKILLHFIVQCKMSVQVKDISFFIKSLDFLNNNILFCRYTYYSTQFLQNKAIHFSIRFFVYTHVLTVI